MDFRRDYTVHLCELSGLLLQGRYPRAQKLEPIPSLEPMY